RFPFALLHDNELLTHRIPHAEWKITNHYALDKRSPQSVFLLGKSGVIPGYLAPVLIGRPPASALAPRSAPGSNRCETSVAQKRQAACRRKSVTASRLGDIP